MNQSIEIYKSEFFAKRAAKREFASILGISPKSVHVKLDKYYTSRYGSTTCVCGETYGPYYEMSNAGKFQLKKLEAVIKRGGAVLKYGICEACGQK